MLKPQVFSDLLPKTPSGAIKGITANSSSVTRGDIFFSLCLDEGAAKSHIEEAIVKGAVAVVSATIQKSESPVELAYFDELPDKAVDLSDAFYDYPQKRLSLNGVTGTNGKTSVAYGIAQSIPETAMIGTIGYGYPEALISTTHTTPDGISLRAILDALSRQCSSVMMEVSSHAIDQGRVDGLMFEQSIFTNLSQDHLDYHQSMAEYAEVKKRLFYEYTSRRAIINMDDVVGRGYVKDMPSHLEVLTYGLNQNADVQGELISQSAKGLVAKLRTPYGQGELACGLVGKHNLSNLLAMVCYGLGQGMSLDVLLEKATNLRPPPGRFYPVLLDDPTECPAVFMDYAHTPDALAKTLATARSFKPNQLWCIFGCGGERDQAKRPLMGEAAASGADSVILTNDNPRGEDPQRIFEDVQKGMSRSPQVIADRYEAICYAITHAKPNDLVLICGKGHENYQLIGPHKHPFDDAVVASECMKQLRG